jgi:tetratricopeptide repeat protein 8
MLFETKSADPVPRGVDPFYLAHCRFRRRRYDECIDICTQLLTDNPYDKAVWLLKCQAFAALGYVDDTELEEQGIADLLLDDNKVASVARPGTSISGLSRVPENSSAILPTQSVRPMSSATGRPLTGFMRPSTKQLAPKTPGGSLQDAFKVRDQT